MKLSKSKNVFKNFCWGTLDIRQEQEERVRNDRQAVFQLVRDLVQAQFDRGDEELTKRLWQDVADREIDLDRVINLMYTCSFHEDDNEMTKVDETYQKTGLVG